MRFGSQTSCFINTLYVNCTYRPIYFNTCDYMFLYWNMYFVFSWRLLCNNQYFDPTGVVLRCFMAKFGCRWSVILGGLISATGLALGMVVTEIYQVYLTFGVLTGILN
jgi:hypothetical protein